MAINPIRNPILPAYRATIYSHISIGAFCKITEFVFTSSIAVDKIPELLIKHVKSLPPGNYAVEVRDVAGGLMSETYYQFGESAEPIK